MDRGEPDGGGRVDTLPLFPLGTVLLPGASLPLHIFEPRYRQLTIDLVTGTRPGKAFGVVAVREGWGPDDGLDGLHRVGCTAALREVRRLSDGRFDLLTVGERRFRLLEVDDSSAPYLVARVEWLPDLEGDDPAAMAPLELAARAAHRRYCTTAWKRGGRISSALDAALDDGDDDAHGESRPDEAVAAAAEDAGPGTPAECDAAVLPHVLAADCLLPLDDRQELLEQTCPKQRLVLVRHYMTREAALLSNLHAVWAPSAKFTVPHCDN